MNLSLRFVRIASFTACFSFAVTASPVTTTGFSIQLDGVDYYVPGKSVASLPGIPKISREWAPVTVVAAVASVSATDLQKALDTFGKTDDVWTTSFLSSKEECLAPRDRKSF